MPVYAWKGLSAAGKPVAGTRESDGPKSLRQALQQFARQSARADGSAWARGYMTHQLERGHSKSRAYRALANRWLVIIFRIWQDRTLYDENHHLRNIAQRGAKLPSLRLEKAA